MYLAVLVVVLWVCFMSSINKIGCTVYNYGSILWKYSCARDEPHNGCSKSANTENKGIQLEKSSSYSIGLNSECIS